MIAAVIDWRLSLAWLGLASLGSVSAAGLSGASVVPGATVPASALVSEPRSAAPARRPVFTAHRDTDGLFYTTLAVNGQSVRFLIDTGATHMVLRKRDARRLDVRDGDLPPADLTTVGGMRAARWARLDAVEIDRVPIGAVDAVVADGDLPASLLGQDVLARLGSLRIDGDELTIGE